MNAQKTTAVSVQLTLDSDIYQDLLQEADSTKQPLSSTIEGILMFWARTKKSRSSPEMQTMIQHLEILEEMIRAFTEPATTGNPDDQRRMNTVSGGGL